MEKAEFKPPDLVSKFTTTVTYITQDDELYNRITANALCTRKLAIDAFRGFLNHPLNTLGIPRFGCESHQLSYYNPNHANSTSSANK
jgi:hypothetical protein